MYLFTDLSKNQKILKIVIKRLIILTFILTLKINLVDK